MGDLTLDRVHEVLQAALGWEDAHLHRFTAKDPYARITKDELEQGWPLQWLPTEFVKDEDDQPEDCGGIDAYRDFLDTLADPVHPAHLPAVEMTGGATGAFDRPAAEAALTRVQRRWKHRP